MNNETLFIIEYFKKRQEFLKPIKSLSFGDAVWYMKKNLGLEEDTELTHVQVNLFYAAIANVDWHSVITYLKDIKAEKDVKNEKTKKLKYKTNIGMTLLMKTRLTILNTLNVSGLSTAQVVFLLESIKQKTLLSEILTHKEAFKEEYPFLEEVKEEHKQNE